MLETIILNSSITRPANTTQYAAGDVVSDATGDAHHTFSNAALQQAVGGVIESANISIQANQSTLPDLELWLFDTDIANVADNSAFAPTDTEILTCIGVIDFTLANFVVGLSGSGASGNIFQSVENINLPFRLDVTDTDIFGQLVVRNAYTPISGEVFTVNLKMTRD